MELHRVVLTWTGSGVVGNAVTVLHWDGSNQSAPPVAQIKSALAIVSPILPAAVSVTVPNSGDTIDDTTGNLAGSWSSSGGGSQAGASAAPVAAGVGACIGWTTTTIVQGVKGPRRLRGRTFIVPMGSGYYDTDGTLSNSAVGALGDFASALRAAGPLAIWHRPTTKGGTNGTSGPVTGSKVRDKVAFLSSRRD